MYLKRLKIKGFRSYQECSVQLDRGVTVILGGNGAGKSSLLEAAQYSLCGRSFRTAREAEMIREGDPFLLVTASYETGGVRRDRRVSLEGGAQARVDQGGGPRWEPPGAVLCFSPDDLGLIKGPPAERRRFLDEALARRHATYQRLARDYQKVLSQRNRFLQRARAGIARLGDISPWDRQLMSLAFQIYAFRREHCRDLSPLFSGAYERICGGTPATGVTYQSQLDEYAGAEDPEAAAVRGLEQLWSSDLDRGATSIGIHRDDVVFLHEGKSLRVYGSQGEQRSAVLALLLADAAMDAAAGRPLLLLDDVLSELDPDRRSRLLGVLGNGQGSQVIITAADRGLIPADEAGIATVIEVDGGKIRREREAAGV